MKNDKGEQYGEYVPATAGGPYKRPNLSSCAVEEVSHKLPLSPDVEILEVKPDADTKLLFWDSESEDKWTKNVSKQLKDAINSSTAITELLEGCDLGSDNMHNSAALFRSFTQWLHSSLNFYKGDLTC